MKAIPTAALALAVLLGGCTSSLPSTEPAGSTGDALTGVDASEVSAEQAAEISDREVTAEEYEAAFQRYRECLNAAGFEMTVVQPTASGYHYGVSNAAVEDGADAECYLAEFRYVDMLWQSSDLVQNSREAAPVLQECLRERGIEPGDTAAEVDEQLREAGVKPHLCLR